MRELKFRAWVNDHWTDFLPTCKTLGEYNANIIDTEGYTYEINNPFIVEQYTGLNDKFGRAIYEGDIVQIDDHILGDFEVLWHNLGWKIKRSVGFEALSVHKPDDIVVIGNIHENPELLERDDD